MALLLVFAMLSRTTVAQDTIRMDEVKISAEVQEAPPGFKHQKVDAASRLHNTGNTMADLFMQETPAFIKSYGAGHLATVTFRGTDARHTPVYWNGVEMSSPAVGLTDLALIPVFMMDEMTLNYGASSLMLGSGGLGGNIDATSRPHWNRRRLSLMAEGGSFHTATGGGDAQYGSNKVAGRSRLFYRSVENNFTYRNTAKANMPVERMDHAGITQYGAMQDVHYRINNKHTLSGYGWYQYADRQVPPTNISHNRSRQEDEQIRGVLEWRHAGQRHSMLGRAALFSNILTFTDTVAGIHSRIHTQRANQQLWYRRSLMQDKVYINSNVTSDYAQAHAGSFEGARERHTLSAMTNIQMQLHRRFTLNIILRQELVDGQVTPFLPALGIRTQPLEALPVQLRINVARNYRAPTLNDRYWTPGGNPDLLPESSRAVDGGLRVEQQLHPLHRLEVGVDGYFMEVDNWILWAPGEAGYWEPQNIKRVYNRGVEAHLTAEGIWRRFRYRIYGNYGYTVATNAKVRPALQGTEGKQLIYVPRHSAQAAAEAGYRGFYLKYLQIYTGRRFITTDNIWYLPFFTTGNVFAGKQFHLGNQQLFVQARINNLWDWAYQIMAHRPMPGRAYYLTLKWQWGQ